MRRYALRALVLCCLFAATSTAGAQPNISPDLLRSNPKITQLFRSVVARPSESTVRVICEKKDVALGTIVAADGYIVTKATSLTSPVVVKFKDGKELPAQIVGIHEPYDIALLKVEAKNLVPIQWRESKETSAGRWVSTVGPGVDPIAIGVVSVATRSFKPGDQPPKNAGTNSGYLGVMLEEAEGGAKIRQIVKGSPAEKAGLRTEDIVIQAGTRKVVDMESLINAVQARKPGEILNFKVQRGKETLDIKATLEKLPKQMLGNPQERLGSTLSNRRGGFPTILQHDTVLLPSDCGGPIVDLDSKAVGINIARAGRTETYAVPSEAVLSLLDDLKSGKLAPPKDVVAEDPPPRPINDTAVLRVTGQLTAKDPLDKLQSKSFHKVHVVKLMANVDYIIDLSSADFDSYLRLEDAAGKKLAEDDDSGGDVDARIAFRPTADGDYRIIVTSFDPAEVGNYSLVVRKK